MAKSIVRAYVYRKRRDINEIGPRYITTWVCQITDLRYPIGYQLRSISVCNTWREAINLAWEGVTSYGAYESSD